MGAEAGRQIKRVTRPLIGHNSVLGVQTFTYLAGLQLLLVGGRSTLLAGAAGIIAGCLYKVNFLGLKKLRVCGSNALCCFMPRSTGAADRRELWFGSLAVTQHLPYCLSPSYIVAQFPAAVTSFFANTIGLLLRDTPQQQVHGALQAANA